MTGVENDSQIWSYIPTEEERVATAVLLNVYVVPLSERDQLIEDARAGLLTPERIAELEATRGAASIDNYRQKMRDLGITASH